MNVNVKIIPLDRPKLLAANAWLDNKLWSIYFSQDKKMGYIVNVPYATVGDAVRITEGPTKDIGTGIIIDVVP